MNFQNNKAKKKVIPTKAYSLAMLYHHCTMNLNNAQPRYWPSNCFTPLLSQTFSTLTQYMSVSHGFSTISGVECDGWCKKNKEKMVTLTRHINELWRCSSIDINGNEKGLPYKLCTRATSM